jgi:hypothetical protein
MVTKKTTAGKRDVTKVKLRKETIKDLDVKGKAGNVKGGATGACITRHTQLTQ